MAVNGKRVGGGRWAAALAVAVALSGGASVTRGQSVLPGDYIAGDYVVKPYFKPGNALPKLTRFGWTISPDDSEQSFRAYKAMADDWGYMLTLPNYYLGYDTAVHTPGLVQQRLVDLARSNPSKYEVALDVPRPIKPYEDGLETYLGTATYQQLFLKDASGALILKGGRPMWSPTAPDSALRAAAGYYASEVKGVRDALSAGGSTAKLGRLLNGGEYGMGVPGFDYYYWFGNPPQDTPGHPTGDPSVIASVQAYRDAHYPGRDYLDRDNVFGWVSERKSAQEKIFTDAFLGASGVQPKDYHFYISAPSSDIGRYGGWWAWSIDYATIKDQFPLPAAEAYPGSGNTGYVQNGAQLYQSTDILTKALTTLANQIHAGGPEYSYNYVSSGWSALDGTPANTALSIGFFKAYYTAGMLGAVENFYNPADNGGFGQPINVANGPPQWIRSLTNLPHVHAAFTWLDDFLLSSHIMPGPLIGVYSDPTRYWFGSGSYGPDNLPAYELPALDVSTGLRDEVVRVIAREGYGAFADNWLVTVWASDGIARDVEVTIPGQEEQGPLTLSGRAAGSLYYIVLRDGKLSYVLLDEDAAHPSLGLERRLNAIRGSVALVPEPGMAGLAFGCLAAAGLRRPRRGTR